jgi:hypothetical protein
MLALAFLGEGKKNTKYSKNTKLAKFWSIVLKGEGKMGIPKKEGQS